MKNKRINISNGEFRIDQNFLVSNKTTLTDLIKHFGTENLKESNYVSNCYLSPQIELDGLYFKFRFYIDGKSLNKINFEIEEKPIERTPWSNNRDFETNWIAQQMDDSSNFIWNMQIAGRHYELTYDWGSIGVSYDFKNGTFESTLSYSN